RWSEGLNYGVPWMMFVLILPVGHTLVRAEPTPKRAKIFRERLSVYWIIKGDELGRTGVDCTLRPFDGSASSKLIELNRLCSGELFSAPSSISVDRDLSEKRPVVFISYSHDSNVHREKVLGLSERLRADGVETILDRYVQRGAPPEGWPRWMLNGLETATH